MPPTWRTGWTTTQPSRSVISWLWMLSQVLTDPPPVLGDDHWWGEAARWSGVCHGPSAGLPGLGALCRLLRKTEVRLHFFPVLLHPLSLTHDYFCRFSSKKGFYCQVVNGDRTKCLGRSKGRPYPPMKSKEETYLRSFYRKDNIALSKLLQRLGRSIPTWLQEELADLRWRLMLLAKPPPPQLWYHPRDHLHFSGMHSFLLAELSFISCSVEHCIVNDSVCLGTLLCSWLAFVIGFMHCETNLSDAAEFSHQTPSSDCNTLSAVKTITIMGTKAMRMVREDDIDDWWTLCSFHHCQ